MAGKKVGILRTKKDHVKVAGMWCRATPEHLKFMRALHAHGRPILTEEACNLVPGFNRVCIYRLIRKDYVRQERNRENGDWTVCLTALGESILGAAAILDLAAIRKFASLSMARWRSAKEDVATADEAALCDAFLVELETLQTML